MVSPSFLISRLFDIIVLIMLIRILLSWIPNINWYNEPAKSLKIFTDYIFEPFRRVVPPIGMLDISPIFAFIVIRLLQELIVRILISFGL